MEAKLKENHRWNSVVLFSGREYVKNEFRFVPPEYEALAQAEESLEVRQEAAKEPEVVEVVEPVIPVIDEPVVEPTAEVI
jgi:hypothetical protein